MSEIDDKAVFVQIEPRNVTEAPDGYVLDRSERGKVHFLNPTAVLVYESCDGTRSVGDIELLVQKAFGLSEPPSQAVRDCLANLLTEELVKLCTPSSSAP